MRIPFPLKVDQALFDKLSSDWARLVYIALTILAFYLLLMTVVTIAPNLLNVLIS